MKVGWAVVVVVGCESSTGANEPAPCKHTLSFAIERVIEDRKEMVQMAQAARYGRNGDVTGDHETWTSHDEGHEDSFVRSDRRDTLAAWVEPRRAQFEQTGRVAIKYGEQELRERYWRTYYVAVKPIVTEQDVVEVELDVARPERAGVWFTFGARGRAAFAKATETVQGHKLAFEIGVVITSAPIVEGAIEGGRVMVRTGGTPAERVADAKRIAAAFSCAN